MKNKIQLISATFLLVSTCIFLNACGEDWKLEYSVLTDASHGSLESYRVVATGEVRNVTQNSATILFSANYNYKKSLEIEPGIKYRARHNIEYGYGTIIKISDFTSSACEVTLKNLQPNTTYYYCAYAEAINGGNPFDVLGVEKSFTTSTAPIDYTTGEAVDLGLSVKWASKDIGSSQPEEWGGMFYWGGIEEDNGDNKIDWHKFSSSTLKSNGYIDDHNNLCPSYDAATQIWGDNWRMPTKDECQELLDKCSWKGTMKNGEFVFMVTGPNGNFIYLPNKYGYDWDYKKTGSDDNYTLNLFWSSTDSYCLRAYNKYGSDISFKTDLLNVDRSTRLCIRPVMK